jgi:hypothetical protein
MKTSEAQKRTTELKLEKEFCKLYNKAYNKFYVNDERGDRETDMVERILSGEFDRRITSSPDFKALITSFVEYRGDFISSDRECAAFLVALEEYLEDLSYARLNHISRANR